MSRQCAFCCSTTKSALSVCDDDIRSRWSNPRFSVISAVKQLLFLLLF